MNKKTELSNLTYMATMFAGFYFWLLGTARFANAVTEAPALTKWYAQEQEILCLLLAFGIAEAIGAFVSQQSARVQSQVRGQYVEENLNP